MMGLPGGQESLKIGLAV